MKTQLSHPTTASLPFSFSLFSTDPATTAIYPLSLHDALPIWANPLAAPEESATPTNRPLISRASRRRNQRTVSRRDRKSTRLNSSHGYISYAVFCLKKKKDQ